MKPQITVIPTDTLPTREEFTWNYPVTELSYIFEQIKDGDRENNETFYLYKGRLYESYETDEM